MECIEAGFSVWLMISLSLTDCMYNYQQLAASEPTCSCVNYACDSYLATLVNPLTRHLNVNRLLLVYMDVVGNAGQDLLYLSGIAISLTP